MRVVLDTNVVLDLVAFRDPGVEPLRAAIEAKRVAVVTSVDCLDEFRRVLGYPEFRLDAGRQADAFRWFETRAERAPAPPPQPLLPQCRDADDQKFLDLAWVSRVDFLVTKDRALLDLARRVAELKRFLVSSPTDVAWPPA